MDERCWKGMGEEDRISKLDEGLVVDRSGQSKSWGVWCWDDDDSGSNQAVECAGNSFSGYGPIRSLVDLSITGPVRVCSKRTRSSD